ncbi:hypothetical protein Tco_0571128 [Tanacetum coccineum]
MLDSPAASVSTDDIRSPYLPTGRTCARNLLVEEAKQEEFLFIDIYPSKRKLLNYRSSVVSGYRQVK